MKIIIHQSICGERQKEWSLLKTTLRDTVAAKSVAFNTGLHDQVGGIKWEPTIRGFEHEDFFLLMKTYPDNSPDVRPKRVFSHVLMIQKMDFVQIMDIGPLFNFFSAEVDKNISISPIEYDTQTQSDINASKVFQGRFNKVISGYRNKETYKNTFVWVGEEDYNSGLINFWKILTASEKGNFCFGIYFNSDIVPQTTLNFITTPEAVENKFLNHDFLVVRKSDKHTLTNIIDQIVAGENVAVSRIARFNEALGINHVPREKLDRLIIGIKPFEELEHLTDLKKMVSLAHIIAEFSPSPLSGKQLKEKLVDRISHFYENAEISDYSLVRTFPIQSFEKSERKLLSSLEIWMKNNVLSVDHTKKESYLNVIDQPYKSQLNWWSQKIESIMSDFFANVSSDQVRIIYNWIKKDLDVLPIIQDYIATTSDSQSHFCKNLPDNLNEKELSSLRTFAGNVKWYQLYATLLIRDHNFEDAINKQLLIDTSENSNTGIEVLLSKAKPKQIVDVAVIHGDSRLIAKAGDLCYENSSLLKKIDFSNVNWMTILERTIIKDSKVTEIFPAKQKIDALYDSLISGNTLSDKIWQDLSQSEYANLINYKNREAFWRIIPARYIDRFLETTSSSLLNSLSKNPHFEIPEDVILSEYIIDYGIGTFLYYNPLKNALPIFNRYPSIPEHYITTYIQRYSKGDITVFDARQFGKLILSRNFNHVAQVVYDKANRDNNWRYALKECHNILDVFTKGAIVFTRLFDNVNITADQWWEGAEEIIIDLYSNSTSLVTIWKKAGGKESDLLMNSTTKNAWSDALGLLRNRRFTKITMCDLLKEIHKTYSSNNRFMVIYDLRKKFISCK